MRLADCTTLPAQNSADPAMEMAAGQYILFALEEDDVKSLLRESGTDEEIAAVIRGNVASKWEGHEINTARFIKPLRTMHAIGG